MTLVSAGRLGGFLGAVLLMASCGGGADAPSATGTLPSTRVSTVAVLPPPGASGSLVAGQSLQLTASPRDVSGNVVNATVIWSSSATSVATVSSTGLVTAVGAGTATIGAVATTSTSTASSTFVVTVAPAPELTTITVSPASPAIQVGQTVQLTTSTLDQNGITLAATVSWSSSTPGVATVSATGLVTGVAAGSATITAQGTFSGKTVSANRVVTVAPATPVLTTVTITPATSGLQVGTTLQLASTTLDQNGAAISATVTWSSSNTSVATVSASGLVTALAVGSASITAQATAGGTTVSAVRALSVTPTTQVLSTVAVSGPGNFVVVGGSTLQLSAAPRDQDGNTIAATVTWSSSASNVASVSGSGLVTGVAGGNTTIVATASVGGVTVTGNFAVNSRILSSVVISGGTTVSVGATLQLIATPRDQSGTSLSAPVTWSSSDNSKATVSGAGLVSGLSAGSPSITATAALGSAVVSAFITIVVNTPFPASAGVAASGLTFAPPSVDIAAGGQVTWSGLTGHNVTFTSPGSPAGISGAASGSRTFPSAGSFGYFCTIHGAGMSGTVIVH